MYTPLNVSFFSYFLCFLFFYIFLTIFFFITRISLFPQVFFFFFVSAVLFRFLRTGRRVFLPFSSGGEASKEKT